jgi:O-methyltransferase
MARRTLIDKLKRKTELLTWGGIEAWRFRALISIARTVMPRYRIGWYQLDWWQDIDFNTYLARFGEERGHNIGRRWMVHQLLRLVADVPGDTAECGVYQGAGSYLICKANVKSTMERTHFMFDSFEGLSPPRSEDGSYWRAGDMRAGEAIVLENLEDCGNTKIMKGWIPSRFAEVADRRFAFVHIDVDLYEPTKDALEFFYPRLSVGGILLCDDFGFTSCPGATRAIEELTARVPEKMIALPDGGGFFIKGKLTSDPAAL